jgi:nitrate reductase gamma subunit
VRGLVNSIVFDWYPYLVLAVFLLGNWLRFDRTRNIWRDTSSRLLDARLLTWDAIPSIAGISVIFIGHFVGLMTPISVFEAIGISHNGKQWMAIVIGGIAGLFGFIGISLLVYRTVFDARVRMAASLGEIVMLFMVFIQLTLGVATITISLKYLDGCAMVKFMTWAQVILTFRPGMAAWRRILQCCVPIAIA